VPIGGISLAYNQIIMDPDTVGKLHWSSPEVGSYKGVVAASLPPAPLPLGWGQQRGSVATPFSCIREICLGKLGLSWERWITTVNFYLRIGMVAKVVASPCNERKCTLRN